MLETMKIPDTAEDIKFSGEEKTFTFSFEELKFFTLEIKSMLIEGKEIDFGKATRNAKYLAEIDRRSKEVKAGHYVEHELIEVNDE